MKINMNDNERITKTQIQEALKELQAVQTILTAPTPTLSTGTVLDGSLVA